MIPTYELTREHFEIKGRGIVYTATLTCECNANDVMELVGTEVEIKGLKRKIIGVESFCVYRQAFKPIGLLLQILPEEKEFSAEEELFHKLTKGIP